MTMRPHLLRGGASALLVTALVLAGCGVLGDALERRGGGPDVPVSHEPAPPVQDPAAHGAEFVEPDPAIRDAAPHAIEHFVIGPDGRTVVVYWYGGVDTCYGLQRVDVDSSGSVPLITVFEGWRPESEGMACIMIAQLKATVVTLDEPVLVDRHGDGTPRGVPDFALDGALPVTVDPQAVDGWPVAIGAYQVSPDGHTLTVHYIGGTEACYAPSKLTVEQDDGEFRVALWEGRLSGQEACIDIGLLKAVETRLAAPLLLDGAPARG
jgi:hypothetical protein